MDMKRALFVLIVMLLFAAAPAHAQLIKHWGLFGGVTSSEHEVNEYNLSVRHVQGNAGFHLGGFAEWLNIPRVSILTEFSYAPKKVDWEYYEAINDISSGNLVTRCLQLHYLSLAVLGKVTVPAGVILPYFIGGPRLDFLVGHENNLQVPLTFIQERFKDVIWGLTFGGGIQTRRIGSVHFLMEFRYNLNLNNSYELIWLHPFDSGTTYRTTMKNSSFDVSVGVAF